jgi:hypothetical protein
VVDLRSGGELLIAKYGDPGTGTATCLEFYRVLRHVPPEGTDHFVLIYHDWDSGGVIAVQPVEKDGRFAIFVSRQTKPGGAEIPWRLRYALQYHEDHTMTLGPDLASWPVQGE